MITHIQITSSGRLTNKIIHMDKNYIPIAFKAQISINEVWVYDEEAGTRNTRHEVLLELGDPHLSHTQLFEAPHKGRKGFKEIPSDWKYGGLIDVHTYKFYTESRPSDIVVGNFMKAVKKVVKGLYLIEQHYHFLNRTFPDRQFNLNSVTLECVDEYVFKSDSGYLYHTQHIDDHIYFKGRGVRISHEN